MAATDTEILARLRLINTDGIGPVTFYKLLKTCRSAENALRSLPPKFHPAPLAAAEREISLARAKGIKILAFDNPEYPQKLRELEDAPPFLYVKGRTDILNRSPAVSVVGARNASINGRKLASRIAYDLTGAGVLIVSGMARGIDAASHKGAMYALEQNGPTVAVLGTGADIVYPAENFSLYEQIAAQGAVISEFPLGTEAQSGNFPRRNRIVSALADAVLVVEAGIHSGSLITARLALEQGRDVFAVPGSPVEARAAGPQQTYPRRRFSGRGRRRYPQRPEPRPLPENKAAARRLPRKIYLQNRLTKSKIMSIFLNSRTRPGKSQKSSTFLPRKAFTSMKSSAPRGWNPPRFPLSFWNSKWPAGLSAKSATKWH